MSMHEQKMGAIEAGVAAGEEAAKRVFRNDGIAGVAVTVSPSIAGVGGAGYAAQFAELWKWNGEDNWQNLSLSHGLAKGVHPYHMRAYDEGYAKGAKRVCEMAVFGYLDAKNGVPFEAPEGDTLELLRKRVELRERRCKLGERPALVWAYEAGYHARMMEVGGGE